MITAHKLYLALKEAEVSDDAAAAAAEELGEFLHIRSDIAEIKGEVITLRGEITSLKWMFGITWTLLVVVLGAMVQVLLRLPAGRI
jgi:hypothetical protein